MRLVSVIVPVYKVEKYIDRCLESIVCQSYRNLEIILVDDGSPDQCGEICDHWAQKDSRIHVIHKDNGGLSDARNAGTVCARGEYITYVDSDDYVSPDFIQYLVDLLEKNHTDISCCGMVKTDSDSVSYSVDPDYPNEKVMTGREACSALLGKDYMRMVTAWGKIYRSNIARSYPFPQGRLYEDEATTAKFYYAAKTVVAGRRCLYAYFQNPKSITHCLPESHYQDKIWALAERAKFFEGMHEKKLMQRSWDILFRTCIDDSLEEPGKYDQYWVPFLRPHRMNVKSICRILMYKIVPELYKKRKSA